jgi:hypothetical protein
MLSIRGGGPDHSIREKHYYRDSDFIRYSSALVRRPLLNCQKTCVEILMAHAAVTAPAVLALERRGKSARMRPRYESVVMHANFPLLSQTSTLGAATAASTTLPATRSAPVATAVATMARADAQAEAPSSTLCRLGEGLTSGLLIHSRFGILSSPEARLPPCLHEEVLPAAVGLTVIPPALM